MEQPEEHGGEEWWVPKLNQLLELDTQLVALQDKIAREEQQLEEQQSAARARYVAPDERVSSSICPLSVVIFAGVATATVYAGYKAISKLITYCRSAFQANNATEKDHAVGIQKT